jgi:hypothetical protein
MSTATLTAPATTVDLSTKERWNKSVREIRKVGIAIKQNVRQCCRSCVTDDQLGMKNDTQPYAFTYGGQGNATKWADDETMVLAYVPRWQKNEPVKEVYINHGNGSAQFVADTFRANGFTVVWDGSAGKCVTVKVNS